MFVEIRKELLHSASDPALPLVVHTVGLHHQQESIRRSKGLPQHHLLWVTSGGCLLTIAGQEKLLGPGDGFFCRPDIPHAYIAEEGTTTSWFTFSGADNLLDYCGIGEYCFFQIPAIPQETFTAFYTLCTGNSTALGRSAAGYTWLTDFLAALSEPHISPAQKVRQYLEVHYSEPLTLEQIADHVSMSKYALCHYYGRTQGITVMEQLRQIRIDKARHLLRFSACCVEEIGRQCGFESASYFGKQFREVVGLSPGAYRRECRH